MADELVEKIAAAINPLAFEEAAAWENCSPTMQNYYRVICDKARERARAIIARIEAEGMVIVPREPTDEMVAVAADIIADRRTWPTRTRTFAEERADFFVAYKAAVAATPKPPTPSATGR